MIVSSWLQGLGLGASLIIAIGAQNAFVLRQGLARRFVFTVAVICVLCDASLITLGVGGLGTIIAQSRLLTLVATWGGIIFLAWYGWRSLAAARKPQRLTVADEIVTVNHGSIIAQTLAVSLLNPHVYLDTVVLVGSVGAHYPLGERLWFALGAIAASTIWFFSLAFGASKLTPFFRQPRAWQILDSIIGIIMWGIAALLLISLMRTV